MIKKLRRKFVLTTMGILFFVFAAIIAALNISFARIGQRQTQPFLNMLAQGDGTLTPSQTPPNGEMPREIFGFRGGDSPSAMLNPIYAVKLDISGEIIEISPLSDSASSGEADISGIIKKIAASRAPQGSIGTFRYSCAKKSYGELIIVMDAADSAETSSSTRLFWASLAVGLIGLAALFPVSLYLSRFVTKPAEDAFNKQKQFISDASHELKTPLSIISVNADVLSGEIGENKYMDYIRSQARRMDKLIKSLLELARMDDAEHTLIKARFDLSEALYQTLLPFESTAFEHKIEYSYDISENCIYNGESESIKQVAAILLDNAFKHTPNGGSISISLAQKQDKPVLTVLNTGEGIPEAELEHIFERFYRCDKSRADSMGSYGLGLSIAKGIVAAHGGQISCQSVYGEWVKFTVLL